MSKTEDALNLSLVWSEREITESPRSPTARLKHASREAVCARLESELPNASDEERRQWMADFERRFPGHFDKYAFRGDIKSLSGKDRWRLINGENFIPQYPKKSK